MKLRLYTSWTTNGHVFADLYQFLALGAGAPFLLQKQKTNNHSKKPLISTKAF